MNTEMLLYFINEHHWNINERDSVCTTCLHSSVQHDDLLLIKYLIGHGSDLNYEFYFF